MNPELKHMCPKCGEGWTHITCTVEFCGKGTIECPLCRGVMTTQGRDWQYTNILLGVVTPVEDRQDGWW